MITESVRIITASAVAAIVLAVVAAGSYAYSASIPTSGKDFDPVPVANSTIIKNRDWPIKGNITMQPCTTEFCLDA